MAKVVKPRKRSSDAFSPLKRKRARKLHFNRSFTSGDDDTTSQMSSELKNLAKPMREEILKRTGVRIGQKISRTLALAIKSHVNLTWAQQRKLNKMLKPLGIQTECEKLQRTEQNKIIGNSLICRVVNFEFPGDHSGNSVVKEAPFVHVNDLDVFVLANDLQKLCSNPTQA